MALGDQFNQQGNTYRDGSLNLGLGAYLGSMADRLVRIKSPTGVPLFTDGQYIYSPSYTTTSHSSAGENAYAGQDVPDYSAPQSLMRISAAAAGAPTARGFLTDPAKGTPKEFLDPQTGRVTSNSYEGAGDKETSFGTFLKAVAVAMSAGFAASAIAGAGAAGGAGAGASGAGAAGAGGAGAAGAAEGIGAAGAMDLGGGLTMAADGSILGGTGAFVPATAGEMGAMGLGAGGAAGAGAGAGFGGGGFGESGVSLPSHELTHSAGEIGGLGGGGGTSGLGGLGSILNGSGGGEAGAFDWTKLIGPAISAVGGIAGANAASSAADAQLQAAREAQAKMEPWYQAGGNSLTRLQELLGIGGNKLAPDYGSAGRDFGMADFNADPGYAFRKSEGEQGLQRAASAQGGIGSGKFLKDAMGFNQGLASQDWNNSFNRFQTARTNKLNPLQSLAGLGQSAAGTIGDLSTQGGNAIAAGKVGQANALTGAISQGISMYNTGKQQDQNQLFQNALMARWANGG